MNQNDNDPYAHLYQIYTVKTASTNPSNSSFAAFSNPFNHRNDALNLSNQARQLPSINYNSRSPVKIAGAVDFTKNGPLPHNFDDRAIGTPIGTPPIGTPPFGTPTGTPVGSPGKSIPLPQGKNKTCYLNKARNIWEKNSIPDFGYDPALRPKFKNAPYEIFRELRTGIILKEMYKDRQHHVLDATLNDSLIFEQPNLSQKDNLEKRQQACFDMLYDLADIWAEGYFLIPDIKAENIGQDGNDNSLLFDWHYEALKYEEFDEHVVAHLTQLVDDNEITAQQARELLAHFLEILDNEDLAKNSAGK